MRVTKAQLAVILSGSFFFALLVIIVIKKLSLTYALAIPVGLVGAGVVVFIPFIGLMLVALFTQLDALANLLFGELPISGIKVLTFFTLAGVVLNLYRTARRQRLGNDELILRLAVLFGCVLVVSSFFAKYPDPTLHSLTRFISLLVLLYLTIYLVRTQKQVEWIFLCIIGSTAFSAIIILYDWKFGGNLLATSDAAVSASWQGLSRSTGASDYDATASAGMALTGTTLAMFYGIRLRRWLYLTIPTIALGSAAVILSFARSAALCYAIAAIWLILKFYRDRRLPLVIVTAAVLVAGAIPLIPNAFWDRIQTLQEFQSDNSMMRRLSYNLTGLDMVVRNPVFGVGPGNFRFHYIDPQYRFVPGRVMVPKRLSNMYLEVAAEVGLIGAAVFGGMLLTGFVGLIRVRRHGVTQEMREQAEALQYTFVTYLIISLFAIGTYNKYTWILLGLTAVVTRIGLSPGEDQNRAANGQSSVPPPSPPDRRPGKSAKE